MHHFDETTADCLVYTFKEGLLSVVAHDLEIRVTRFTVDYDEVAQRIEARFDPRSLRVVTAMKDGEEAPGLLSDKDKAEIASNIERDVLDAARYPDIKFLSTAIDADPRGHRVRGTLTLHGRPQTVTVLVEDAGTRQVAQATLHQPDFGIKPYSALLGTLKLKPDVKVRLSLPLKRG